MFCTADTPHLNIRITPVALKATREPFHISYLKD